jgi:hypothetical protein
MYITRARCVNLPRFGGCHLFLPILPGRGPEVPGGCRVIQAPRFRVFDVGIVNELARRGTRSAPADGLLVVGMPSLPSVIGMGPLDSSGRKRMPGPEVASKCSTVGARVSGVAPLGGGPRGAGAAAVPEREGNPIVDSAGRKPAATLRHLRPLVTRPQKTPPRTAPSWMPPAVRRLRHVLPVTGSSAPGAPLSRGQASFAIRITQIWWLSPFPVIFPHEHCRDSRRVGPPDAG